MSDERKMEDCGICEHCKSPLKKFYHYDGRGTNAPSTVEYFCKCPKMSDERKELLKHFNEITREYHQHCEWTEDKYSAVEKIEELIQQQPEIDGEYLQNKTIEMIEIISKGKILEAMSFLRGVINDVQGREKIKE